MIDFKWISELKGLDTAALLVVLIIAGMLIGGFFGRYFWPSGKDRLAAKQEDKQANRRAEDNQIEQMRAWYEKQLKDWKESYEKQIQDLKAEHEQERKEDRIILAAQGQKIAELEARMNREEKWNREYRHALANREHLLGFALDTCLEFVDMLLEEVKDVPNHFLRQRHHMKSADELRKGVPLPEAARPNPA